MIAENLVTLKSNITSGLALMADAILAKDATVSVTHSSTLGQIASGVSQIEIAPSGNGRVIPDASATSYDGPIDSFAMDIPTYEEQATINSDNYTDYLGRFFYNGSTWVKITEANHTSAYGTKTLSCGPISKFMPIKSTITDIFIDSIGVEKEIICFALDYSPFYKIVYRDGDTCTELTGGPTSSSYDYSHTVMRGGTLVYQTGEKQLVVYDVASGGLTSNTTINTPSGGNAIIAVDVSLDGDHIAVATGMDMMGGGTAYLYIYSGTFSDASKVTLSSSTNYICSQVSYCKFNNNYLLTAFSVSIYGSGTPKYVLYNDGSSVTEITNASAASGTGYNRWVCWNIDCANDSIMFGICTVASGTANLEFYNLSGTSVGYIANVMSAAWYKLGSSANGSLIYINPDNDVDPLVYKANTSNFESVTIATNHISADGFPHFQYSLFPAQGKFSSLMIIPTGQTVAMSYSEFMLVGTNKG